MTWLASSWIGNLTPSSDEKDAMGDNVPEVRIIQRVWEPSSEKTLKNKQKQKTSKQIKNNKLRPPNLCTCKEACDSTQKC